MIHLHYHNLWNLVGWLYLNKYIFSVIAVLNISLCAFYFKLAWHVLLAFYLHLYVCILLEGFKEGLWNALLIELLSLDKALLWSLSFFEFHCKQITWLHQHIDLIICEKVCGRKWNWWKRCINIYVYKSCSRKEMLLMCSKWWLDAINDFFSMNSTNEQRISSYF